MQAGGDEAGGVADVVQPRGGFRQSSVGAENWRPAACPGGDALDVRPAAGRLVEGGVPGRAVRVPARK